MTQRNAPSEDTDDDRVIPSAEVANHNENQNRPVRRPAPDADPMRLVKVRSREYIAPFFYGKVQYSLPAGKDVLLPLAVKKHLEEKNAL